MEGTGAVTFPRLSRSARILLEELLSFGTDRVIEPHHFATFLQNCTIDFGDRFYLILGELRMKGYIERVGDGYRVIRGKGLSPLLPQAWSTPRDSALPM